MIKQEQLEQRELEMSGDAKRLYLERCAVSGAAGLALERQDTPARPAPAVGRLATKRVTRGDRRAMKRTTRGDRLTAAQKKQVAADHRYAQRVASGRA